MSHAHSIARRATDECDIGRVADHASIARLLSHQEALFSPRQRRLTESSAAIRAQHSAEGQREPDQRSSAEALGRWKSGVFGISLCC